MLEQSQPLTKWTPERDDYIRQNYRTIPTRKIGADLGVSKSAVIGRANRIGLSKPYAEAFNLGRKFEIKPKATTSASINVVKRPTGFARMRQEAPRVKKLPIPELNDPATPLNGVGVKMWDLSSTHCRWVIGEPKDLTFCGHEKHKGSFYCPTHFAISKTSQGRTNK
jgi:hypothetical protein